MCIDTVAPFCFWQLKLQLHKEARMWGDRDSTKVKKTDITTNRLYRSTRGMCQRTNLVMYQFACGNTSFTRSRVNPSALGVHILYRRSRKTIDILSHSIVLCHIKKTKIIIDST